MHVARRQLTFQQWKIEEDNLHEQYKELLRKMKGASPFLVRSNVEDALIAWRTNMAAAFTNIRSITYQVKIEDFPWIKTKIGMISMDSPTQYNFTMNEEVALEA